MNFDFNATKYSPKTHYEALENVCYMALKIETTRDLFNLLNGYVHIHRPFYDSFGKLEGYLIEFDGYLINTLECWIENFGAKCSVDKNVCKAIFNMLKNDRLEVI